MTRLLQQRTLMAMAIATAFAPAFAAETIVQAETVEVIGSTPLAGIGIPRLHVPANVQTVSGRQLEEQ